MRKMNKNLKFILNTNHTEPRRYHLITYATFWIAVNVA